MTRATAGPSTSLRKTDSVNGYSFGRFGYAKSLSPHTRCSLLRSGGVEEHGFGGDAGAEGHGAALLAGLGAFEDLLEDEHDGGGGHVAVAGEDVAEETHGLRREFEAVLDGVEDGTASGIHGPEVEGEGIAAAGELGAGLFPGAAQLGGDLAGELHVEAAIADLPGNEVSGFRNADGEEAVEGDAARVGGNEGGAAAIGEEEEGEDLLEVLGFLHVQGAEFEVEDEDTRLGRGADDVVRGLEGVDGGVTAHEADHGALDGGVEAEVPHHVEVEAGSVEAGAGGDEDVADGAAFLRREGEAIERALGQARGVALEGGHAAGRGWEAAHDVEVFGVAPVSVRGRHGLDEGLAVFDTRTTRHAAKQAAGDAWREQGLGEF